MLRVAVEFWGRTRRRGPKPTAYPVAAPAIELPRRSRGLSATWVGHSTVLLQLGPLNVLTDPMFSDRAFPVQWFGPRRFVQPAIPLATLPPLDAVLISHNHYDHLDRGSVLKLVKLHAEATWFVPLGVGNLIRRCGAAKVIELDWWETATLGLLSVTATPARHFSGRGLTDRNRTLWCGFSISTAGMSVFYAGDTAYHPGFGEIGSRCGPFDLMMIPMGAYEPRWIMERVHANPEEAVRMYQDIAAAHPGSALPHMLGIHWGTFRLTTEPMDEPPLRAAARWRELGLPPDRLWIPRHGQTLSK